MKHINGNVNINTIIIFRKIWFHELKMAQNAIYWIKSSWTLQGSCWWRVDPVVHHYIIKFNTLNTHLSHSPCPSNICWSRLIIPHAALLLSPLPTFSAFFNIMQWVQVKLRAGDEGTLWNKLCWKKSHNGSKELPTYKSKDSNFSSLWQKKKYNTILVW